MGIERGENAVASVPNSAEQVALSASVIGMMGAKAAADTATAPRTSDDVGKSGAVLDPNPRNAFALTGEVKGKIVSPKSSSSSASDLGKH